MSYAATDIDFTCPTTPNGLRLAISAWLGAVSPSTTPRTLPVERASTEAEDAVGSSAAARTQAAADLAVRDLTRYGTFQRGWDGYDGEVFQPQTISRAVMVVNALYDSFMRAQTEPTEITPGPISDGRIDVEAACDGRRLIVTLEAGTDEVGIFYDDRGAAHEGPARWESDDLERWVRRLTGEDRMSALVHHAPQPAVR